MRRLATSFTGAHLVLLVATAILWCGILVCVVSGSPAVFPDTPGYEITQRGLLSLIGDSKRAWPTVLLFSLSPDYRIQTLMQAFVYGIGWTATLWVFLRHWRPGVCALTAGGITALALSPLYLQWTLTILSEATTIGLVFLGLASAQLLHTRLEQTRQLSKTSWSLLLGAITALGMAAMNRMTLLPILVVLGAILAVRAARSSMRGVSALVCFFILLMSAYVVWLNGRINEQWKPVSRLTTNYIYLTGTREDQGSALTDQLHAYLSDRAPSCLRHLRMGPGNSSPKAGEIKRAIKANCPEGAQWLSENFQSQYARFLLANPAHVARAVIIYLPQSAYLGSGASRGYAGVNSILPAPLPDLFTTLKVGKSELANAESAFAPIVLWSVAGVFAAGVELIGRRKGVPCSTRTVAHGGLAAAYVSLALAILNMNYETARITSQSTALLFATTILSIGGLVERCRRPAERPDDNHGPKPIEILSS